MPDVIIIGGGISGLSAAYEIARAGASVTLLEQRRFGAMASRWTLGGVRQSGRHPAELPLATAAVARWGQLDDELGAATGYRRHGNLRLARTADEVAVIRRLVDDQRALGLSLTFLPDNTAVRAIAPAIGPDILAASFCPGDGHADPDLTVAAFADAAKRYGADLREGFGARAIVVAGERVTGVEMTDGTIQPAAQVIVATGVHAPELLGPCGVDLPLLIKRVSVLRTIAVPETFLPVFGVANADCAGRQEHSGHFRLTNGIGDWPGEPANWTLEALQPSLADMAGLIALVSKILPVLGEIGFERAWGGLIDLTPDALPLIDTAGPDGLIVAAGFSGHGFGIGPVTGQILKALALGENPGFDLSAFRAGRFRSGDQSAPLSLHG